VRAWNIRADSLPFFEAAELGLVNIGGPHGLPYLSLATEERTETIRYVAVVVVRAASKQ